MFDGEQEAYKAVMNGKVFTSFYVCRSLGCRLINWSVVWVVSEMDGSWFGYIIFCIQEKEVFID